MKERVLKELEHLLVKKVLQWQRENTDIAHVMEDTLASFFEGYEIHKGECKGFLERYIEMDAKDSDREAFDREAFDTNYIVVSRAFFEHLLNCLANQKFLHTRVQSEREADQKVIDVAWDKGMDASYACFNTAASKRIRELKKL